MTSAVVGFTEMQNGTKADYELLARFEREQAAGLAERVLGALAGLEHSLAGYQVSRLEHSLQSATRAYRAGEDEETVVAALLHDIGDALAPHSHGELAAAVLRPFVSAKTHWIVKHHGVFQMLYYAHHIGGNRNAREQFRGHKWFDAAAEFCEKYDQNCFDPAYQSEPLAFFASMVRRIFAREPFAADAEVARNSAPMDMGESSPSCEGLQIQGRRKAGAASHIAHAALGEGAVRVVFGDGRETAFHFLWMRDNCPHDLHPQTKERGFDLLSVAADIAPARIAADAATLSLWWGDEDAPSIFPAEWLRANAYDDISLAKRRRPPKLWDVPSMPAPPRFDFADVVEDSTATLAWLRALRDCGLTIVGQTPPRSGAVRELASLVAPPRRTNYGDEFEVRSKAYPNNLAYTALALTPHTDLPFYRMPPGVQFLHCLANDASGGESIFVDGFRIADELRTAAPALFATLCDTPLPFRFHDDEYDIRCNAPTITLDRHGDICLIRHSLAMTAQLDAPFAKMEALYRAHRAFAVLTRDPRFALELCLAPGDTAVLHNHRILHGRRAFDPATGARHLHGCYVDWDETLSRIRILERTGDEGA